MIFDFLIPKLRQRFPGHGLKVGMPPAPCAVFPAIHPEVGDVVISDDRYELTLQAGNFTHSHFSNYEDNLSEEQKAERIAEDVAQFLEELFADRVILWGSHNGGGGWYPRDAQPPRASDGHGELYVWSGPMPRG
jgi:hypothetical protein